DDKFLSLIDAHLLPCAGTLAGLVPAVPPLFFFHAEDGIRDKLVTGVQTCALPISRPSSRRRGEGRARAMAAESKRTSSPDWDTRSEERRVGKECRYRWLLALQIYNVLVLANCDNTAVPQMIILGQVDKSKLRHPPR